MQKVNCCNANIKVTKQGDIFIYRCPICKKQSEGKTPADASAKWSELFGGEPEAKKEAKKETKTTAPATTLPAISKPTSPANIEQWAEENRTELIKKSAQWIGKSAQQRMIEKNLYYIINHKGLAKVWNTEEGRDSITHALEEANWYGADMPDMGSIIPFKKTCEFVASIEVFSTALTTGVGAPFEWIEIIPIYQNDIVKRGRKDDDYYCDVQESFPRGDLIGVVCWGKLKNGKRIGQSYDIANLTEKAREFSAGYKASIVEQTEFNILKSEGKTKIIDGRDYYIKNIKGYDGKPDWTKKIFYDEILNPYTGSSKEKMYCKLAGKSYFKEFMKRRNAMAMAGEHEQNEKNDLPYEEKIDTVLQIAKENVSTSEKVEKIFDGEIIPEEEGKI